MLEVRVEIASDALLGVDFECDAVDGETGKDAHGSKRVIRRLVLTKAKRTHLATRVAHPVPRHHLAARGKRLPKRDVADAVGYVANKERGFRVDELQDAVKISCTNL